GVTFENLLRTRAEPEIAGKGVGLAARRVALTAGAALAATDTRVHVYAVAGFERGDFGAYRCNGSGRIQAENGRQLGQRQEGIPLGKVGGDILEIGDDPACRNLDQYVMRSGRRHRNLINDETTADLV